MKFADLPIRSRYAPHGLACGAFLLVFSLNAWATADFTVTTPGNQYAYMINTLNANPTITLIRGKSYTFALNTSSDHPFAIATAVGGSAPTGVSGNNGSSTGTITFSVPQNAADCVYYCTFHLFSGQIHMIDAPTPPTVNIIGLTVGPNITLTTSQTTTNGFSFIPEASTNLATTNWFALTVQSNRFNNGVNEIFCGKPPGTNVFFRIRIQ